MKKFLIIANWKLNNTKDNISEFLKYLNIYLLDNNQKNIISIAPSFIYLEKLSREIKYKNFFITAQNVDINLQGAFTGEISVLMLKDIGVQYVILGHSERRILHHENNNIIAKKFSLVKKYHLTPILCIGETEKEKKLNKTYEILKNQINSIFEICGTESFRNTVIAYEPIWAIGTGKSADIEYVQKIHKFIKNYIIQYDHLSLDSLMIQYGGSITSLNAREFLEQMDVDGLLIGTASLQYKEFLKIVKISNNIY
ncbi:triose-phosphate isomerase [Buchnera aphidicola]|uniref:triose-phosphate isomerase n=1 Tax=Buchnera aphidicola TaxID=9 RepID=UPI003BEF0090